MLAGFMPYCRAASRVLASMLVILAADLRLGVVSIIVIIVTLLLLLYVCIQHVYYLFQLIRS